MTKNDNLKRKLMDIKGESVLKRIKIILTLIGVFLIGLSCASIKVYASEVSYSFSDDEIREICYEIKNEIGNRDYLGELIDDFSNIKKTLSNYKEKVKCEAIIVYLKIMKSWENNYSVTEHLQREIVRLGCMYFKYKNCVMAAELLEESHRLASGDDFLATNEKYVVLNSHRVVHTPQYLDLCKTNLSKGSVRFELSSTNFCENDCYYALRNVDFERDEHESQIVNFTDTYDFAWTSDSPNKIEALCNIFYYLTKTGVIKEYDLIVRGEYPHHFEEMSYDNTKHFTYCSACGFKSEIFSHTYQYSQHDYDYHNKYCIVCGFRTKEKHNWAKYNIPSGDYGLQYIPGYKCRKCGLIREGEVL